MVSEQSFCLWSGLWVSVTEKEAWNNIAQDKILLFFWSFIVYVTFLKANQALFNAMSAGCLTVRTWQWVCSVLKEVWVGFIIVLLSVRRGHSFWTPCKEYLEHLAPQNYILSVQILPRCNEIALPVFWSRATFAGSRPRLAHTLSYSSAARFLDCHA